MLAELRFAKALGTFATGRTAGAVWSFKRSGYLNPLVTARAEGSDSDLAAFRAKYTARSGVLTIGGETLSLRALNFWGSEWGLEDGAGRLLMRIHEKGMVHFSARYELTEDGKATERPGTAALPVLVRPGVDGRRFLRIEARCTLTSGIDATNLSNVRLLYLAAHGGFAGQAVALGGGAAVFNLLMAEWAKCAPFDVEAVTPAVIGAGAPTASDIAGFKEREYAQFCDAFREASTRRVLEEDPGRVAVLVNDVSEGPDFARLARRGYRMSTIYHVDVVAYIARIYLRGHVAPWTLTRAWRAVEALGGSRIAPRILRLIFEQQAGSVEHSSRLVVPSRGMKETLLQCYPDLSGQRVLVLPWGMPPPEVSETDAASEAKRLRAEFGVPEGALVLATLSRISPEKGHDLLLKALLEWESRGGPGPPLWLFICGEAAFMQGGPFLAKLKLMAERLRRIKVVFCGYVSGARKAGFLRMADLYVFPSRHESYGLTLMEAMGAGLPSVALEHDGSRESLAEECGVMIPAGDNRGVVFALAREIEALAANPQRRAAMASAASAHAQARPFSLAAARLASSLFESD